MKAFIIDCETTGLTLPKSVSLEDQPKIIEIAFIRFDLFKPDKNWKYNSLINPCEDIDSKIEKLTGISNDELKDAPTFAEQWPNIKAFIAGAEIMIAHNVRFDKVMLFNELQRIQAIYAFPKFEFCTANEFSHLFGHLPTLEQLYMRVFSQEIELQHRALNDCVSVFEIMRETEAFERMAELLQQAPKDQTKH